MSVHAPGKVKHTKYKLINTYREFRKGKLTCFVPCWLEHRKVHECYIFLTSLKTYIFN